MRNACAHSKRLISFKTPELAAVAKRTFDENGMFANLHFDENHEGIRKRFVVESMLLFGVLARGEKDTDFQKLKEYFAQEARKQAEQRQQP